MHRPTQRGNVTTVDSKGRVVLPKRVRDRLDIGPGTVVSVREENGRVIVDPEDDPESIIADLETTIDEASSAESTVPDDRDPLARDHVETVRRGARDDA